MGVNVDGGQSCLNALSNALADFASPADAVQVVFDVSPAFVLEAQKSSASRGNAGESYQFDDDLGSPGAGPEPNLIY